MKHLNKEKKMIRCECDGMVCRSVFIYKSENYPSYKECQKELKNCGWIARKIEDDWCDFCSKECYQSVLDAIGFDDDDTQTW